jgi:hypothetical protein
MVHDGINDLSLGSATSLGSAVPMVHPVIARNLLILSIDELVMNANQDGVVGTVLAQFVSETHLLRKGTSGIVIHLQPPCPYLP